MRLAVGWVGVVAIGLAGCAGDGTPPTVTQTRLTSAGLMHADDYLHDIERWREARLQALRAPDGWLSYSGSGWLPPGRYRLGSADDNDVVLPGVPAQLGVLHLDQQHGARFIAAAGADARLRGVKVTNTLLVPDQDGKQGDQLQLGRVQFSLLKEGQLYGWRFRDAAAALPSFDGIDYFPIDREWRIEAQWLAYAQPRSTTMLTSIGTPSSVQIPGEALFWRDGQLFRLQPLTQPGANDLLFVFTDRTSGKDTYGGARYLWAAPPRHGRIVLDFNRAENPPCAFTPHTVCLIAAPQNRLNLSVNAGEKTYLSQ
jgi:uncharacterized protein (DUF1684 family)